MSGGFIPFDGNCPSIHYHIAFSSCKSVDEGAFVIPEETQVFLDVSLKRFDIVYPAAGTSNSAVELSIKELEDCSRSREWIDVCKDWEKE